MKFLEWRQAMNEELQAMDLNNTYIVIPLPPGKQPIGCWWIYKIKHNSDGTVARYKARLVAQGFT